MWYRATPCRGFRSPDHFVLEIEDIQFKSASSLVPILILCYFFSGFTELLSGVTLDLSPYALDVGKHLASK